jgi:hypothetical protein
MLEQNFSIARGAFSLLISMMREPVSRRSGAV